MLSILQKLLNGLDKISFRVEQMTFFNANRKTALALIFLSKHIGKFFENQVLFDCKFNHELVASIAGVSRETVSRELKKLQKKGVIEIKYNCLTIKDFKKLREISDYDY